MRILIIHDREEVAEQIAAIARDVVGSLPEPDCVSSYMAARDKLRANQYDLAIMDLTLPMADGLADTQLKHAELLLKSIFEKAELHSPADILGISNDAAVIDLVRSTIGQHLMACINEDAGGLWKKAIEQKLRYVANVREARQRASLTSFDVDLAIITALDIEATPFRDLFELSPVTGYRSVEGFAFRCKKGVMRRGVLYSAGFSGQASAASATQAVLMCFRPRLALMTGICGGVKDRTKFGDLLAFRSSYAWDYGKWVDQGKGKERKTIFQSRPTPLNVPDEGIIDIVRHKYHGKDVLPADLVGEVSRLSGGAVKQWEIELTAAASGSAVVTSTDIVEQIRGLDENIHGIEMESYAFYLACRKTPVAKPDFLCLKSVADHCNGQKNSKLHKACSLISAYYAHEIVSDHYDFS